MFVWNRGNGHDTVEYFHSSHALGDGFGKLKFGPGIAPGDVEVKNSGNHVVFALLDGSGGITFVNVNKDVRTYPDEIHFADGTVWKWSEMPRK